MFWQLVHWCCRFYKAQPSVQQSVDDPPCAHALNECSAMLSSPLEGLSTNSAQHEAITLPLLLLLLFLQVLWFYVGMCDIAEASALNLCHGRLLLPLTLQCFNAALCGSQAELDVHAWRAATLVSGRLREEPGQRTAKMFWQVSPGQRPPVSVVQGPQPCGVARTCLHQLNLQ